MQIPPERRRTVSFDEIEKIFAHAFVPVKTTRRARRAEEAPRQLVRVSLKELPEHGPSSVPL